MGCLFGSILWRGLKIELDEALECNAFFRRHLEDAPKNRFQELQEAIARNQVSAYRASSYNPLTLGLKSGAEWRDFCKSGNKAADIRALKSGL